MGQHRQLSTFRALELWDPKKLYLWNVFIHQLLHWWLDPTPFRMNFGQCDVFLASLIHTHIQINLVLGLPSGKLYNVSTYQVLVLSWFISENGESVGRPKWVTPKSKLCHDFKIFWVSVWDNLEILDEAIFFGSLNQWWCLLNYVPEAQTKTTKTFA